LGVRAIYVRSDIAIFTTFQFRVATLRGFVISLRWRS
jgi:hypothetical protein